MKKNYLTPQVKIAHIGLQSILCNSKPDPAEKYIQVYSEKTTTSVW